MLHQGYPVVLGPLVTVLPRQRLPGLNRAQRVEVTVSVPNPSVAKVRNKLIGNCHTFTVGTTESGSRVTGLLCTQAPLIGANLRSRSIEWLTTA